MIRAAVTVPQEEAEDLRARFLDLAPEGFEEREQGGTVELAGYGEAAARILAAFPQASLSEIEEGWEDSWRAFHHAIQVGPLWVGPPWEEHSAEALPVVIDPGRAFGTGAHPTTRLCLELLLDRAPGSMLDLGCGSGVLAIAAVRLGFGPVVALDLDPIAVEVTRENAVVNGVEIESDLADALSAELPLTDLTVSNIAFAAIQTLGPRLRSPVAITSGYLVSDEPQLPGYSRRERRELGGWAADLFERD